MKVFLKFTTLGIVGLTIVSCALVAINYYFYSWTSFIHPFGCERKQISGEKELFENYDLSNIMQKVKSNPNFQVKPSPNNEGFSIFENFNGVAYRLTIFKEKYNNQYHLKVSFGNNSFSAKEDSTVSQGETATTPNHYIKSNIERMIDEIFSDELQRQEIKKSVNISCKNSANSNYIW